MIVQLLFAHAAGGAPLLQQHECAAVEITATDMPSSQAALALAIYLEAVDSVESTDDFSRIIGGMTERLRNDLGGFWDIFSAGGTGKLSYALRCSGYVELLGEAWIAVLCRQREDGGLMRCDKLSVHSGGTLTRQAHARLLQSRQGDEGIADHQVGSGLSTGRLTGMALAHYSNTGQTHGSESFNRTRDQQVNAVTRVLSNVSLNMLSPMLASKLLSRLDELAVGEALGDDSVVVDRTADCVEEHRRTGRVQCLWGVAIESDPEGLHASSAEEQFDLRGLGLVVAAHRLACRS